MSSISESLNEISQLSPTARNRDALLETYIREYAAAIGSKRRLNKIRNATQLIEELGRQDLITPINNMKLLGFINQVVDNDAMKNYLYNEYLNVNAIAKGVNIYGMVHNSTYFQCHFS